MLWYDAQLFAVVLLMVPVLWGINRHFHRWLSHTLREVQESYSRVTATLAESVNGVRVTQGFVRQQTNARIFSDLVDDHSRYNMAVTRSQAVFLPLVELNSQFCFAALLLVGGFRALQTVGGADLSNLMAFLFMANLFFAPIIGLGGQYNQALAAMAGAERVFSLLDTQPEWIDPPAAEDLLPLTGRVEFLHVTFGYDRDRPVLEDVNFVVEAGQTVALSVAPSLPAAAGPPHFAVPVTLCRTPPRPTPRRHDASLTAIAGQRMHRPKQPFAALQQATSAPCPATMIDEALIRGVMGVILEAAQGRSCSRKVMSRSLPRT